MSQTESKLVPIYLLQSTSLVVVLRNYLSTAYRGDKVGIAVYLPPDPALRATSSRSMKNSSEYAKVRNALLQSNSFLDSTCRLW